MKKILFIPLLFIALCLSAAPVGEKKARELAESFFSSSSTRSVANALELEYVESISGKDQIYVYNRQGGGFAVIAGDDRFSPVIAFSHDNVYDSDNIPPAAKELLQCWARQIAAGKAPEQINAASMSEGNIIVKYDTPSWGQGDPYNLEAPVLGGSRCVTGCVATAMSIVAYYNKWPQKGIGTTPEYSYTYNGYNAVIPANSLGRTYDYGNMLMSYSYMGYESSAQRNAVAALMKDMGTSVYMSYSPSASGAVSEEIPVAMSKYFSYSKSAYTAKAAEYGEREWAEALQQNIKTCGPTIIGGQSSQGGHAFIFDGCTDNGYFSVNFGWDGASNGYYMLPSIEFNQYQDAIMGLVPDRNGTSTYEDRLGFISLYSNNVPVYYGIVINSSELIPGERYSCSVGGIKNAGTQKFVGVWKIAVCDAQGNVRTDLTGEGSIEFDPGYYFYNRNIYITMPQKFMDGDRIRVVYKGQNSKDWKWLRRTDAGIIDQIILCGTSEEIAEGLSLKYDKSAKTITLNSQIPVQYEFSDYNSNVIASGDVPRSVDTSFSIAECATGVYVLKVASGSAVYSVAITL